MIDIHHHCLAGVDDGPSEWAESVEMCRIAAEEGIEAVIATPHVLRGRWRTVPQEELHAGFAHLHAAAGHHLRLHLGSEYFFAHDVTEVLRTGGQILPLAGSRYVLTELAANSVPPLLEQPLYRMQLEGWVPILAHPERNLVFQQRPELLVPLVRAGVRMQITAGSLTGAFGPAAERAAKEWVVAGLVHFVATDAHNTTRRPPRISEALAVLRSLAGDEVTDALTRRNPQAVLDDHPLPYEPEPQLPRHGLFNRIRRLFAAEEA